MLVSTVVIVIIAMVIMVIVIMVIVIIVIVIIVIVILLCIKAIFEIWGGTVELLSCKAFRSRSLGFSGFRV